MSASALDTLVITNRRACWLVDRPRARATSRRPRLTIAKGLPDAQSARACCRDVRVDVLLPRALTSLNSAAYSALSRANGPPIRYWSALSRANGSTSEIQPKAFAFCGATGRHDPGCSLLGNA